MINATNSIRTSPSHNGRYHRSDRKEVLEFLQESSNLTMTQVANQFNLSPSTVHHWVHRYLSKIEAQEIVQRGHAIRGEQISKTAKRTKYRAHKQQERIDSFKAFKAFKASQVSVSLQNHGTSIKQTLLNMKAQIEEMLKHV